VWGQREKVGANSYFSRGEKSLSVTARKMILGPIELNLKGPVEWGGRDHRRKGESSLIRKARVDPVERGANGTTAKTSCQVQGLVLLKPVPETPRMGVGQGRGHPKRTIASIDINRENSGGHNLLI